MSKNGKPLNEVFRLPSFPCGKVECIKCHKELQFFYNDGRLDSNICCNLIYKTIVKQIDLVVFELVEEPVALVKMANDPNQMYNNYEG